MSDLFVPEDQDDEVVKDFIDSLKDELEEIEHDLLVLDHQPGDKEALNSLFRAVHTIKGNARMCMYEPLSEFVHYVEEALSEVRSGRLNFTPLLGEAVLLSLDQLKIRSEELIRSGRMDIGLFRQIGPVFRKIKTAAPLEAEQFSADIINVVGGGAVSHIPLRTQASQPTAPASFEAEAPLDTEAQDEETFHYFEELSRVVDGKTPFWEKRTRQQCGVALGINQFLDNPVESRQLKAAVMLHDLGMVFLPEALINKTQKYNSMEEKQVRQHVKWSYEWLRRIPHWEEAATMILQHHERPDGQGYPSKLRSADIHDGAQIIAIADTFYSITNQRSDRTYKKSLMRAITEINSYRDVQFKGHIVDAFNQLIRKLYTRKS
ncbi:MAG: Hpt domain-containing protein [Ketobacteraceae bacterium]|nr:Hpt domain-containing protein [Ketobacteraceae bacterium]